MDFIKKYWNMAEGKLAFITNPTMRFVTLALIVMMAIYILTSILPVIAGIIITIGLIIIMFRMFEDKPKP